MTASRTSSHELELRAPNIESGRPVEQDGLDAVIERHARLHVEDDRDRDALGLVCGHAHPFEEPLRELGPLDLEAHRVAAEAAQAVVVEQRRRPEDPPIEAPPLPGPDRGPPAVRPDRMREQVSRQASGWPRPS